MPIGTQLSVPTAMGKCTHSIFVGALSFLILTFSSCTLFPEASLVVWGDRPEYVSYVDYYNSIDVQQHRASFRYVPSIFPDEIAAHSAPDIIIAKNISYQAAKRVMHIVMQPTAEEEDSNTFFSTLFDVGMIGKQQRIIPLSFNIPVFIFNSNSAFDIADSLLTTSNEVKHEAEEFTTQLDGTLEQVGFSPKWDPHFLYLVTRIHGANYHEDRQGVGQWDESRIFEALQYFRNWNINIDNDELAIFSDRYIQNSLIDRIEEGRIGFLFSDLVEMSALGREHFSEIDFRVMADTGIVSINEDITFIGIHQDAKNDMQAREFVKWILMEETQKKLIAHTQAYNVDMFGFAHGLSTIKNISVRTIPQYYPWLIGNIPEASFAPIHSLPKNWNRIRNEVVGPWLQNFLNGIDQESLEGEILKWQKRESFQ